MTDPVAHYTAAIDDLAEATQRVSDVQEALHGAKNSQALIDAWWNRRQCKEDLDEAWQTLSEAQRTDLHPPAYYG